MKKSVEITFSEMSDLFPRPLWFSWKKLLSQASERSLLFLLMLHPIFDPFSAGFIVQDVKLLISKLQLLNIET